MDLNSLLSTLAVTPTIISTVFKFLSNKDLHICSQVSSLWFRIANSEKKRRNKIVHMFKGIYCEEHKTIHNTYLECDQGPKDLEAPLIEEFKLAQKCSFPRLCLLFTSSYLIEDVEVFFPTFCVSGPSPRKVFKRSKNTRANRKILKTVVTHVGGPTLPDNCYISCVSAPGLIAAGASVKAIEVEDGPCFAGLLLPHMPNVDVRVMSSPNCPSYKRLCADKDVRIKCLLVFTDCVRSCSPLLKPLLKHECYQVALAGGVVYKTHPHSSVIIALCGPNVEAASVTIPQSEGDGEEPVVKGLSTLKSSTAIGGGTEQFAMMVCCVANGAAFHGGQTSFKSAIFQRMFPGVPLFGFFALGEIGLNFPLENNEIRDADDEMMKNFNHSYSTVVVLVTVKR